MPIDVKKPVTVDVRCKTCMFFTRYTAYNKPCNQEGIEKESRPCARYMPAMTPKIKEQVKKLGAVIDGFSSSEMKIVAAMMAFAPKLKRHNLRIGQWVYVRRRSGDYLSNFVKARIVGCSRDGISLFGDGVMLGLVQEDSIIHPDKWKKMRERMIQKGLNIDPSLTRGQRSKAQSLQLIKEGLTPTIDQAQDIMDSRNAKKLNLQAPNKKSKGPGAIKVGSDEE